MPRRRSVTTMEKDARALDLFHRGLTYRQIAAELGWKNQASAHEAVRRAIADGYRLSAEENRQIEEERLDQLTRVFNRIVATRHYVASISGKIAHHPVTGEPLIDDGPVIKAALALLRVSESRRKLLGLDAPTKHEVRQVDHLDDEIERLMAELGTRAQAAASVPAED